MAGCPAPSPPRQDESKEGQQESQRVSTQGEFKHIYVLGDARFATIQDTIQHIVQLPDGLRYNAQLHTLAQLMLQRDAVESNIADLVQHVAKNQDWRNAPLTEDQADAQWDDAIEIQERVAERRRLMGPIQQLPINKWCLTAVEIQSKLRDGEWMASRLEELLRANVSHEDIVNRANRAIYTRIAIVNPSARGFNPVTLLPDDILHILDEQDARPLDADELRQHNLKIGEDGFLVTAGEADASSELPSPSTSTRQHSTSTSQPASESEIKEIAAVSDFLHNLNHHPTLPEYLRARLIAVTLAWLEDKKFPKSDVGLRS